MHIGVYVVNGKGLNIVILDAILILSLMQKECEQGEGE